MCKSLTTGYKEKWNNPSSTHKIYLLCASFGTKDPGFILLFLHEIYIVW